MFLNDITLQETTEKENDPLKGMIEQRDKYITDYNYYVKVMRELAYTPTPTRPAILTVSLTTFNG